jgi:pSer/pThr/pTyr-binding forkhead associated (FHA) protein
VTSANAQAAGVDPLAKYSLRPEEGVSLNAAMRDGSPFIAYRDGAGDLHLFVFPVDEEQVLVGRSDRVGLQLAWDSDISRVHAEFRCLAGEWTISDLDSSNGTFLNTRRIAGCMRLRHGDRLVLGKTLLAYLAPRTGPLESTSIAGDQPGMASLSAGQRRTLIALCRPLLTDDELKAPASNRQIAEEVHLTQDAVKMQLRQLYTLFGMADRAQGQKRASLAEFAVRVGLVSPRDL